MRNRLSKSKAIRLHRETLVLLQKVCDLMEISRDEAIRLSLESIYKDEKERRVFSCEDEDFMSAEEVEELLSYL